MQTCAQVCGAHQGGTDPQNIVTLANNSQRATFCWTSRSVTQIDIVNCVQGDMSDGAKDCKAQLKMISLTEGCG